MTPPRCVWLPIWCVFWVGLAVVTTSVAAQTPDNELRTTSPRYAPYPSSPYRQPAAQPSAQPAIAQPTATPPSAAGQATLGQPTIGQATNIPAANLPTTTTVTTGTWLPKSTTSPTSTATIGTNLGASVPTTTNTPTTAIPTTASGSTRPAQYEAPPATARSPSSTLRIGGADAAPETASPGSRIEIRSTTVAPFAPPRATATLPPATSPTAISSTTTRIAPSAPPAAAAGSTLTPVTQTPAASAPVSSQPPSATLSLQSNAPNAAPPAPSTLEVRPTTWPIEPPTKPTPDRVEIAPSSIPVDTPGPVAAPNPVVRALPGGENEPSSTMVEPVDSPADGSIGAPSVPTLSTLDAAPATPPSPPTQTIETPRYAEPPRAAEPPRYSDSRYSDSRYAEPPRYAAPVPPATVAGSAEPPAVNVAADGRLPTAAIAAPVATTPATIQPTALPPALAAEPQPIEILPVDFNGVTLGDTKLAEVVESWGKPVEKETADGTTRCRFNIEPFAGVDVTFVNDTAASIVVDLGEGFTPEAIRRELGIEDLEPVVVQSEEGRKLGLVYPERGVSLRFDDDAADQRVTYVGLDRIDARPFILRAEQAVDDDFTAALSDLETALKFDADSARSQWLKARILQQLGRRHEALAAVEKALKQEPKGAEYLLTRAALLADEGMFAAALTDATAVIEGTGAALHLQARGWCLRGDLLAAGPTRDYAEALDAHSRAIRLAEPLAADKRLIVRRAAKEVLIDAHLGMAEDIAWGNWQQKAKITQEWLDKAQRLAVQWNQQNELSSATVRSVPRRAVGCYVGLQGAADPEPWAEMLMNGRQADAADDVDPLQRRRNNWECGLGLYDVLQTLHTRGDVEGALRYGTAAVELLSEGRDGRDERPTDPYMFGRLYFRIGSLYAVKKQDHVEAVKWFDRAAPLLERPLPEAVAADRGRQGETLVSMGISYWAVGKRERAMQLTTTGSRFMQTAVNEGSLKNDALAVPFSNLAAMHRQLGDEPAGTRYAEMAARIEAPTGGMRR